MRARGGRLVLLATCAVVLAACGYGATGEATDVGSVRATLTATVDRTTPGNVSWWFEWGTTTSYGGQTEGATQHVTDGTPIREVVTGLAPATTYHYRICVRNSDTFEGSCGADATVTTSPYPPGASVDDLAGTYTGTVTSVTDPTSSCYGTRVKWELEAQSTVLGDVDVSAVSCSNAVSGDMTASATFDSGHGRVAASGGGRHLADGRLELTLTSYSRTGLFNAFRPADSITVVTSAPVAAGPATATVTVT